MDKYDPFVKFLPVRGPLALVQQERQEIYQTDLKTAFFNGDHEEETYMEQMKVFARRGEKRKVSILLNGLSGLKQARRG